MKLTPYNESVRLLLFSALMALLIFLAAKWIETGVMVSALRR